MSKIKNYMMDIQEFCDGYYYDGMNDFPIDEVVEDAGIYFKSNEAIFNNTVRKVNLLVYGMKVK